MAYFLSLDLLIHSTRIPRIGTSRQLPSWIPGFHTSLRGRGRRGRFERFVEEPVFEVVDVIGGCRSCDESDDGGSVSLWLNEGQDLKWAAYC
jgi:hypothetical protein